MVIILPCLCYLLLIIINYGEGYCCYLTGRGVWHVLCTGTLLEVSVLFWGSLKTLKDMFGFGFCFLGFFNLKHNKNPQTA